MNGKKDDDGLRINEEITASQVRLVGENIPEQGVFSLRDALRMADEQGLDLVEISAKADPPVCKIIDYQKFVYQQKKKAKEMKANAAKIVIKEIRFGPNTDEHDFQFKLKHAQEFLQELNKDYRITILSARRYTQIIRWLNEHGLWEYVSNVTSFKPPALAYIDDRGIQFNGDYNEILEQLKDFKPYWSE